MPAPVTAVFSIADVERVGALVDGVARAVAEFTKLGSEEKAALPEPARAGISVLLAAAKDFTAHN